MAPRTAFALFGVTLAAGLAGCGETARFVRTKASFRPQPGAAAPSVYLDHAPPAAYDPVGVVIVEARLGTSHEELSARAARVGLANGCDVLVSSPLLDAASSFMLPRLRLAHGGGGGSSSGPTHPSGAGGSNEIPLIHYEFICGVSPAAPQR